MITRALTGAMFLVVVLSSQYAIAESLKDAVIHALGNSPDMLITTHERRSRDHEVRQAESGYYPSVDLTAGYGFEYSDNPSTRAAGNHNTEELSRGELSLSLRQMLFDGYATRSEVERQEARVRSAAYHAFGTAEKLGLETARVYIDVLRQQQLLQFSQENLKVHERVQDQIRLRSESGVGRKADLEQINARVALARSNLVAAEVNLRDAETNYLRVVGQAPGPLESASIDDGLVPANLESALDSAIAQHPILKSALADVDAAKAQHRASNRAFFPRFDLEIGGTVNDDWDGVEGHDNDFTAMVRMRYNLYSGGADKARRSQTAALVDEALEVRNRTRRQVEESLRLSWAAYDALGRQVKYIRLHVDSSEKTRDAYAKQFNIGQRTLLDLLNTENELFEARQSLTNAEFDELFARYRILTDIGGLLERLEVTLPDEAKA